MGLASSVIFFKEWKPWIHKHQFCVVKNTAYDRLPCQNGHIRSDSFPARPVNKGKRQVFSF